MKIEKESFYIWFSIILATAAIVAYFSNDITDGFVVPVVLDFMKVKSSNHAQYARYFSPDVSFFCFIAIICMIIARFVKRAEPIIYVVYSASLFFCFFYFFIAPLESLFVLAAFIVPVFMWHQKRITNLILAGIGFFLIIASWYFLQKPVIFFLMLPMCHLFAIRANNALQSRYSGREIRVLSKLSSTQKKEINKDHSIFKHDLWEIIGPEIEALADSWAAVKKTTMGESTSVLDNQPQADMGGRVLLSMVKIQDSSELITAVNALEKRDPNFSQQHFCEKFRAIFTKIQQACHDHQIETIQAMVSDALYEQFRARVIEQQEAGVRFKSLQTHLPTVRIARLSSDANFDEIHIQVTGTVDETAIDIVTGEALSAEDKTQQISEYWSFLRKPSAKTLQKPGLLEGSCPNCGSPINIGQATICPICSSFIRSGNYDWVVSKITQACEWEFANPRLVPGWSELVKLDPGFTIHQLEDRSAVVFWMLRLVERKRIMEPLLRFATGKCCETYKFGLQGRQSYNFMENVSLASVSLKAMIITEKFSRFYILAVWSGIPVTYTPKGRQPQIHRFSKPRRDVMVFVRQAGMLTNQNNTLSSAHCSKCGGPLTSNFDVACSYCHTILNDGSEWILERIINERSQEFNDIITQKQRLAKKVVAEVTKDKKTKQVFRSGRDLISMSAQMLLADGKIDDTELAMLKKFAERFEMPEEQLQGIIEAVKQGDLYIPQPSGPEEAFDLLKTAVSMALADDEIAAEERAYLESLTKKFGYTAIELNMLIKKEQRLKLEAKKAEEIRRRKLN